MGIAIIAFCRKSLFLLASTPAAPSPTVAIAKTTTAAIFFDVHPDFELGSGGGELGSVIEGVSVVIDGVSGGAEGETVGALFIFSVSDEVGETGGVVAANAVSRGETGVDLSGGSGEVVEGISVSLGDAGDVHSVVGVGDTGEVNCADGVSVSTGSGTTGKVISGVEVSGVVEAGVSIRTKKNVTIQHSELQDRQSRGGTIHDQ